jgi:hypothetical protein
VVPIFIDRGSPLGNPLSTPNAANFVMQRNPKPKKWFTVDIRGDAS